MEMPVFSRVDGDMGVFDFLFIFYRVRSGHDIIVFRKKQMKMPGVFFQEREIGPQTEAADKIFAWYTIVERRTH